MEKVHVLKDESLGGVKREYIEVGREAKVGDYVHYANSNATYRVDRMPEKESDDCLTIIMCNIPEIVGSKAHTESLKHLATIEPTDIVVIGGKRYRIEKRLAEPGELILRKKNGLTYEVVERKGDFVSVTDSSELLLDIDYVVLERVEKSTEDIIANLVRRVAELERRECAQRTLDGVHSKRLSELSYSISGIKDDIETWAQEVETLKHDKESKQITLNVDTFTKLIGGVRG